jgi:hypothetical protein
MLRYVVNRKSRSHLKCGTWLEPESKRHTVNWAPTKIEQCYKSYLKSALFMFAKDALRANQGQAIKAWAEGCVSNTQKWLWSRKEKV